MGDPVDGERFLPARRLAEIEMERELEAQVEVLAVQLLCAGVHLDRFLALAGVPQSLAEHAAADSGQRGEISVSGELEQLRALVRRVRQQRAQLGSPRIGSVERARDLA